MGIFVLLKEAIQELIRGKGSYDERMEGATNAFFRLPSERFPEALRDQVERLHSVRLRARLEYGEHVLFRFRPITPKQRDAFAKDMLDVFTACAMCVARSGEDYLDPARSTEDLFLTPTGRRRDAFGDLTDALSCRPREPAAHGLLPDVRIDVRRRPASSPRA